MPKSKGFQEGNGCLSKGDPPPHLLCPGPPRMATLHLGQALARHGMLQHRLVVRMREAAKGFPLLPTH